MANIRNLVFSGGAATGIAFIGAIEQLATARDFSFNKIQRVAGSSAGALAALMMSLKFTPDEFRDYFLHRIYTFKKTHEPATPIFGFFRTADHELEDRSASLLREIEDIIFFKTRQRHLTFNELKLQGYKDLYITTTKYYIVDDEETTIAMAFSAENAGNTNIVPIIYASAALHGYYLPMLLKQDFNDKSLFQENKDGDYFCDGGIKAMFPERLFDRPEYVDNMFNITVSHGKCFNIQTLGMRVITALDPANDDHPGNKIERINIDNPNTFIQATIRGAISGSVDYDYVNSREAERTALISRHDINTTDFNMNNEEKELLIETAKDAISLILLQRATNAAEEEKTSHITITVSAPQTSQSGIFKQPKPDDYEALSDDEDQPKSCWRRLCC